MQAVLQPLHINSQMKKRRREQQQIGEHNTRSRRRLEGANSATKGAVAEDEDDEFMPDDLGEGVHPLASC